MTETERRYRDAATGEYVTEAYATEHPDTTVAETVAEIPDDHDTDDDHDDHDSDDVPEQEG